MSSGPPSSTPCPVPGIVEEVERLEAPPAGGFWYQVLGIKPPQAYRTKFLVVYPTGAAGELPAGLPAPLSLPIGPALTLQQVYEKVAEHFTLGADGFGLCHRSTGAVVTVSDLHGRDSGDMVAFIDKHHTIKDAGVLTLPLPPGPAPDLLAKNADHLFLPDILTAHLKLLKEHGPLFKVSLPNEAQDLVFVADPDIIDQIVSQPEVWQKLDMKHNAIVRAWVGDGIFTSDDDEPIWGIAHRILLPAFSNQGMRNYFNDVMECVSLVFTEWDKLLSRGQPVDAVNWAERFTFDVIGRVAFSQDFRAITDGKHPYLDRVAESSAAMEKLRTYSFLTKLVFGSMQSRRFIEPNAGNVAFVDEIVQQRKAEMARGERLESKDMLTLMLTAKDPKTGEGLSDSNIRNQILTFLFAGHDSTSTAISSLLLFIAQHGQVERKIVEEVQRVVGDGPLTYEKLGKLEYTTQVINESLRMFPPASAIRKRTVADTQLGPFAVKKGTGAMVSLWAVSKNPGIWPDPWKFDPDRWSPECSKHRSPYASMPFSFGARGCLGRQLSIMEQRIFIVRAVQRYHIRLHSRCQPKYTAQIFLKPHGVFLSLDHKGAAEPLPPPSAAPAPVPQPSSTTPPTATSLLSLKASLPNGCSLLILYGSNMGTCEAYAKDMANQATALGLPALPLPLNDVLNDTAKAKQASAVIIVTSTYNGTPPDNALDFVRFLEKGKEAVAEVFCGVRFAVFGCGNTQWARTYQRIPLLIDQALAEAGGVRLTEFVGGDADSSLEEAFEAWKKQAWLSLLLALGVDAEKLEGGGAPSSGFLRLYTVTPCDFDPMLKIERVASDFAKRNGLVTARVLENRELQVSFQGQSVSGRSTRHIELELPEGHTDYTAGDHLAVYGGNNVEVVRKAAALVGHGLGDAVMVELAASERAATNIIPLQVPLAVRMILTWCVELQQPATRNQVSYLAELAACPPEKKALEALLASYDSEVLKSKRTVLELLEAHPSVKLDLASLLSMLPALKPRFYSISSSPKASPSVVSITVGVVKGPSPTGREHIGVASNFLATRTPTDPLRVFVKDTKSTFRLPADPKTPIILVGPGTGVAPLRGFLLDRQASGASGDAVLFFGCRSDADYIYKDELEAFLDKGVLKALHVAFSRKGKDKVYVQHLIEANGPALVDMLDRGGHVYVCGDAKHMAPDVREAFGKIMATAHGKAVAEGRREVEALIEGKRYHEDVWAS